MKEKRLVAISLVFVMLLLIVTACTTQGDRDPTSNSVPTSEATTKESTLPAVTTTTIPTTRVIYPVLERSVPSDTNPETYTHLITEYSSKFDVYNKKRTSNLALASAAISNIILKPGETFSFNQVVGKRTVARGYQEASVIVNNEFEPGLGGGVCQVASTLFNAVLLANLTPVERSNHSLKITYVPIPFDAAVQWSYMDFQFKNEHAYPVKLQMFIRGGVTLVSQIWAQSPVDVGKITFTSGVKNGEYYLNRFVNGERNYTCYSRYKK